MTLSWDDLLQALRDPQAMVNYDPDTWDLVVRQAAGAGVLGRLASLARDAGVLARLPLPVKRRMGASQTIAEQQVRAVHWELVKLSETLAELKGPIVLLKGAAYAASGLAPAAGRLFSDIDLLVPKDQLAATEAALMLGGWNSSHHDHYDQRYYRQWMHELPPMMHIKRRTVLDLHHNILPETARIRTRPDLIIAAATPLGSFPRFSIPDPADQVLHSATHLFHEGEWAHGLRDLADLDALVRDYGRDPAFWDRLVDRSASLHLGKPLFYGLRYARALLHTPFPADLLDRCPGRPGRVGAWVMDALFPAAFATAHHTCRTRRSGFATWCLYVRSHWLRMPMRLLLPHLIRKSWKRRIVPWLAAEPEQPGDDPLLP